MGRGDGHRLLAPGKSLVLLWHSQFHEDPFRLQSTFLIIRFRADRGDARLRLDQVLVRRVIEVSGISRALAQRWIADGLVSIDQTPAARASIHVRDGAAVEVTLPASSPLREAPAPEEIPLDVLYEDDDLMAINKPAGMVVHPSFRNTSGTLLNGVLWRLRNRKDARPGLVSRLDKDTSGVVVIALSPGVHACIQRDTRAGRVTKEYLAIVRGTPRPAEGTITLPLRHDPADRRRMVACPEQSRGVRDDGAPSETRYRVLSTHETHSLVQCELVTGRTHQIRVHLAARGWPIVGDSTYGSPDPSIARQALHAWRMTLPHPKSVERLTFEAPMPRDMETLITSRRK
jgi:23S rRNA pseudouridine1911/1915/1917 synthase